VDIGSAPIEGLRPTGATLLAEEFATICTSSSCNQILDVPVGKEMHE
jgi:hypothetical protein